MKQRRRDPNERLHGAAPDLFKLLQQVYMKLTHNEEFTENFRVEIRDLLDSIDHADRD